MIQLPTPAEYARLSYPQRRLVLERLARIRLGYLETERAPHE